MRRRFRLRIPPLFSLLSLLALFRLYQSVLTQSLLPIGGTLLLLTTCFLFWNLLDHELQGQFSALESPPSPARRAHAYSNALGLAFLLDPLFWAKPENERLYLKLSAVGLGWILLFLGLEELRRIHLEHRLTGGSLLRGTGISGFSSSRFRPALLLTALIFGGLVFLEPRLLAASFLLAFTWPQWRGILLLGMTFFAVGGVAALLGGGLHPTSPETLGLGIGVDPFFGIVSPGADLGRFALFQKVMLFFLLAIALGGFVWGLLRWVASIFLRKTPRSRLELSGTWIAGALSALWILRTAHLNLNGPDLSSLFLVHISFWTWLILLIIGRDRPQMNTEPSWFSRMTLWALWGFVIFGGLSLILER